MITRKPEASGGSNNCPLSTCAINCGHQCTYTTARWCVRVIQAISVLTQPSGGVFESFRPSVYLHNRQVVCSSHSGHQCTYTTVRWCVRVIQAISVLTQPSGGVFESFRPSVYLHNRQVVCSSHAGHQCTYTTVRWCVRVIQCPPINVYVLMSTCHSSLTDDKLFNFTVIFYLKKNSGLISIFETIQ